METVYRPIALLGSPQWRSRGTGEAPRRLITVYGELFAEDFTKKKGLKKHFTLKNYQERLELTLNELSGRHASYQITSG